MLMLDADMTQANQLEEMRHRLSIVEKSAAELKRTEAGLRESEKKLRFIFDSVPDVIVVTDLKGNILQVNEAITLLKWFESQGRLIGRNAFDFIAEEDRGRASELLVKVLETGVSSNVELTLLRQDGSRCPVEISGTLLKDAAGNPMGLVGVIRDISGRRRVEQQLRESEARLKTTLDSIPTGIVVIDAETYQIVDANPAAVEMVGITREQIVGSTCHKYLCPDKRECPITDNRQVVNKSECVLVNASGDRVTILKSAAPLMLGGRRHLIESFIDINERRRAEEKFEHAAAQWRTTFDSITDAISIHSLDYRILRVNMALANHFKMRPQELIGKHCYEVMHGTGEPPPDCPHQRTIGTRKPETAEFYEPHLDVYLQLSTSPIFDDRGGLVGTVHIARDISEHKRMEERLIMADRLASIGELVSGIAHELNNPLTSVIGFSQLLKESEMSAEAREDLEIISKEAERAAKIVSNLLAFARKHEPVKQRSQVNNIIADVLKLRTYEQKVSNIAVRRHLARDLPEIMVDYFQMQQVFLNIVVNAESAMLEAHNKGTLTISTRRTNGVVKISFTDDGPGIPGENLSRIFNPFFTTKEVGKGTGLGLSICHGIVTAHGGSIYARSKPGSGATFIVELPIGG